MRVEWSPPRRWVTLVAAVTIALGAGCGDDSARPAPTTIDFATLNLGDVHATPAGRAGGDLVTGRFELLDTRPPGFDSVAGSAALARRDPGTTVTVRLTGLKPGDYIAHLHFGSCREGLGHYQFDRDGPTLPPNEIHLAFAAGKDGRGFMTAENDRTVGADAGSVVVHPAELTDNRIACADLA